MKGVEEEVERPYLVSNGVPLKVCHYTMPPCPKSVFAHANDDPIALLRQRVREGVFPLLTSSKNHSQCNVSAEHTALQGSFLCVSVREQLPMRTTIQLHSQSLQTAGRDGDALVAPLQDRLISRTKKEF